MAVAVKAWEWRQCNSSRHYRCLDARLITRGAKDHCGLVALLLVRSLISAVCLLLCFEAILVTLPLKLGLIAVLWGLYWLPPIIPHCIDGHCLLAAVDRLLF